MLVFIKGRAMTEDVSRRSVIANARVRAQLSPSGICGEQSGTVTGFSPSTSVFPFQYRSTIGTYHLHIYVCVCVCLCVCAISLSLSLLPEGQTGEAWEPYNKQ